MRILLPPSEAKHPGGRGRPIGSRPVQSPLEQARLATLAALATLLSDNDPAAMAQALLLPDTVAEAAITRNRRVMTAPTLPAMRRYSGIVYSGLSVAELTAGARQLAGRQLLIFSGLFGVLRGADPIPDYRVPAKATLPGLGVAGSYWRPLLDPMISPLLGSRGPIIDLRSTDYAAMWQPAADSMPARRLITVRILSRRPNGDYAVISYASKLAKGRLARHLLERAAAGSPARSADDLIAAWAELDGKDARSQPAARGQLLELWE